MNINESRIKHLMGNHMYVTRAYLNMMIDSHTKAKLTHRFKELKELSMIYSFYEAQGKTDTEIASLWVDTHSEKYHRSRPYKLKPIRERKDNQNPETYGINYGTGGSNRNKIRVPSKKHKNRYKNFLKLFPHYKEK